MRCMSWCGTAIMQLTIYAVTIAVMWFENWSCYQWNEWQQETLSVSFLISHKSWCPRSDSICVRDVDNDKSFLIVSSKYWIQTSMWKNQNTQLRLIKFMGEVEFDFMFILLMEATRWRSVKQHQLRVNQSEMELSGQPVLEKNNFSCSSTLWHYSRDCSRGRTWCSREYRLVVKMYQ